jgi:hypothetical protein
MDRVKDLVGGMMVSVNERRPAFHHGEIYCLCSDLCQRIFLAVGLLLVLQGCAETSVQRMINANDHSGLATYYTQQAQELRIKAKAWEMTAESYEKHSDPHGKTEPKQHAAHCRAIAHNYTKAADEADELAREHRAMSPSGTMQ